MSSTEFLNKNDTVGGLCAFCAAKNICACSHYGDYCKTEKQRTETVKKYLKGGKGAKNASR